MQFTIVIPIAIIAALLMRTTRNTLLIWLENLVLGFIAFVATPICQFLGITPTTPPWATTARRRAKSTAVTGASLIMVVMCFYTLLTIGLVAAWLWQSQIWVMTILLIFLITAFALLVIGKMFVPVGGGMDGLVMLAMLPALLMMYVIGAPSFALSGFFWVVFLFLMAFGAIFWAWGAAVGLKGHMGPHSMLGCAVLLVLWIALSASFPQDLRVVAAKKAIRDNRVAGEALIAEIQASKKIGYVATAKGTPVYKGWYFDQEGKLVNVAGQPAKDSDLEVAKDTTGNDWIASHWQQFKTRDVKMEDVQLHGETLVPVLFPDSQNRFVMSRDLFWLVAEDTSLYREVEATATPTPATATAPTPNKIMPSPSTPSTPPTPAPLPITSTCTISAPIPTTPSSTTSTGGGYTMSLATNDEPYTSSITVPNNSTIVVNVTGDMVIDPCMEHVGPKPRVMVSTQNNPHEFPNPSGWMGQLLIEVEGVMYPVTGQDTRITIPKGGVVKFLINDRRGYYGDNSGNYTVAVKVVL